MRQLIKVLIILVICCVTLIFVVARESEVDLPEQLQEITLDNIDKLVPLIRVDLTGVNSLGWSNDGKFLAVAIPEGIWIYTIDNNNIISDFIKTDKSIYGRITFIAKSTQFIAGDSVYDAATLTKLRAKTSSFDYISSDGSLYADREDQAITIKDTETNTLIMRVPLQQNTNCDEYGCGILSVAFSPDNKNIAFSSLDLGERAETGVLDIITGNKTLFPLYQAWSLNYSPDGSMIAFSVAMPGREGRQGIQIIDSKAGTKIGFVGISGSNNSPVFSRDGRLVVIGGTNYDAPNLNNAYGTLYFYSLDQFLHKTDLTTKEAIRSEVSDGWVNAVAFSPDYRLLATGDTNIHYPAGQLILWGISIAST